MAALPQVTQTLGLNLSQRGRLVTSVGRGLVTQPTDGSRIIKGPGWKPDPRKIPQGKQAAELRRVENISFLIVQLVGYSESFMAWTAFEICVSAF